MLLVLVFPSMLLVSLLSIASARSSFAAVRFPNNVLNASCVSVGGGAAPSSRGMGPTVSVRGTGWMSSDRYFLPAGKLKRVDPQGQEVVAGY